MGIQHSTNSKPMTMEQLMAAYSTKPVTVSRGDKVSGKVIAMTANEIIVDLGAKSEGIINKKDLSSDQAAKLQIGDNLEAFVISGGEDNGQILLSTQKQLLGMGKKSQEQSKKWQKFFQAMQRKTHISGRVVEANKGGLVIEAEGIRGFLPSSQVSLGNLTGSKDESGLSGLIGQELSLTVIEVDPVNNRLILSTRGQISQETQEKLAQFQVGQKVTGKIMALAPYGLLVDVSGVEGVVYTQEVSWGPVEKLDALFKTGQEIEGLVTGKDEELGRVNLSIRQLTKDPFEKIAEDFQADDVVKGKVINITQNGVEVQLQQSIEGFVPTGKIETGINYTIGEETNFLVDSIDKNKRRVNLAPFLTSTVGLIYK